MKKIVNLIVISIISIMLLSYSSISIAANVNSLKNQQSENEKEIEEKEKELKEIQSKKSENMKQVENLIGQISDYESEIDDLEEQISDLKKKISSTETKIKEDEEKYRVKEEQLKELLVATYENGKTSYLDFLLSSSNLIDFISTYYLISELTSYDTDLLEQVEKEKQELEKQKSELETNKSSLDAAKVTKEAKSAALKAAKSEKEKKVANLTSEEKETQKEIEELEAANRQIQNEIKQAEIKYKQQLDQLQNQGGNVPAGSGYFIKPIAKGTITAKAYYSNGNFHGAIDYGAPSGTTVYAAADGVVMSTANLTTSYGTYIVIRHGNGLQTYYAHGTKGSIVVKPGDIVKQGQKIMLSGNTGNSKGAHLHFEVRVSPYKHKSSAKAYGQDSRVNPLNYL